MELESVITSDDALESGKIPESITIIGAGAIGLEFATYYRSLGAGVTMVEMMDTLLPGEDEDVTSELLKIMKRQGIKFHLGSRVKEIRENQEGLETIIENGENTVSLISDTVLAAIGRRLNCDTALMASLGIDTRNGSITVNDHMETSAPGVYAAGDVIGGKLLAHLAFAQGRVAAENAMGLKSSLNYNSVPACVYTNPEVASVGLSEQQAKEQGIDVKVGRYEFRNNGRALSHGEREGFVKVITESASGVIIGARILGLHASELISELTLAVTLGANAEVLADMIHPHPTLSECVMEACGDAIGRAIHK
jgi:dihydrolipoamide dehydrogenase